MATSKKTTEKATETKPKTEKKIEPKFKIGDIVFISKEADTDLEGFKLFPEYKNCTYTVEAYDEKADIYSLRRLNLLLKLKGEHIVSPEEREHNAIYRRQF